MRFKDFLRETDEQDTPHLITWLLTSKFELPRSSADREAAANASRPLKRQELLDLNELLGVQNFVADCLIGGKLPTQAAIVEKIKQLPSDKADQLLSSYSQTLLSASQAPYKILSELGKGLRLNKKIVDLATKRRYNGDVAKLINAIIDRQPKFASLDSEIEQRLASPVGKLLQAAVIAPAQASAPVVLDFVDRIAGLDDPALQNALILQVMTVLKIADRAKELAILFSRAAQAAKVQP